MCCSLRRKQLRSLQKLLRQKQSLLKRSLPWRRQKRRWRASSPMFEDSFCAHNPFLAPHLMMLLRLLSNCTHLFPPPGHYSTEVAWKAPSADQAYHGLCADSSNQATAPCAGSLLGFSSSVCHPSQQSFMGSLNIFFCDISFAHSLTSISLNAPNCTNPRGSRQCP